MPDRDAKIDAPAADRVGSRARRAAGSPMPGGPAKRSDIAPFIVMDVLAEANERQSQGEDIIHLEVGQPGTPAPALVREAAKRAIDSDRIGYTEAVGIPELRVRIAQHYRETYGVTIAPERVVVTTGSSAGFVLTFLALFDEGATVALPSPGYPCYRHILRALGLQVLSIETKAEGRWMPQENEVADLASRNGISGLLLASPANPTGTMLSGEALKALANVCEEKGLWLISDEIYHGLTYEESAETALAFSDNAIVINSFSKYFSMTGWRIGWMIVPEALVRTVERLVQNLYISAPTLSQFAAIAAFDARDELEAYKAVYQRNRELLLDALPSAGFPDLAPADGAFYLYANVAQLTNDSAEFAAKMLSEIGVAITPGLDFDSVRGNQYVRFSYAGATEDIEKAAKRIHAWLA